jgi:hypothetical protein
MRSFICYLGILSMMLISPPLAVNIGADESTVEKTVLLVKSPIGIGTLVTTL